MAVAPTATPMLCLRCGVENQDSLRSCPTCDPETDSMQPAKGMSIGKVPLVRKRADEVFAEAIAMLGTRADGTDSFETARLPLVDDENIPTIAAPDELPMETARGAALVDAPEGDRVVEEVPEPIPENEPPLFPPKAAAWVDSPAEASEPPRRSRERRTSQTGRGRTRPRGGLVMMIASCIGMTFAGTAIGSMQFGVATPTPVPPRVIEMPAPVATVEQVFAAMPPTARPAPLAVAHVAKKKTAPSKKKAPAAKSKSKRVQARR